MKRLSVWLTPELTTVEELRGGVAVVIDVLRATTTIAHALHQGADRFLPCLEVADARRLAERLPPPVLLGGERQGKRIDGFDLGNSPGEYPRGVVEGATIVFTTTNGTRALRRCRAARRVLTAAFVNFSAVCEAIADEDEIDIVCAGTDGEVTREDALLAGAMADDIERRSLTPKLNDQALLSRDAWQSAVAQMRAGSIGRALRDSSGARNLIDIGHHEDIELAAQFDTHEVVPELGWEGEQAVIRATSPRNDR